MTGAVSGPVLETKGSDTEAQLLADKKKEEQAKKDARAKADAEHLGRVAKNRKAGGSESGAMDAVTRNNEYDKETVMIGICIEYLFFFAKMAMGIDFIIDSITYNEALSAGFGYDGSQIIYAIKPDGKPDYDKIIDFPSVGDVIKNGYVPAPDYLDSIQKTLATLVNRLNGPSYLPETWSLMLFGVPDKEAEKKKKKAAAKDNPLAAQMALGAQQEAAAHAARRRGPGQ